MESSIRIKYILTAVAVVVPFMVSLYTTFLPKPSKPTDGNVLGKQVVQLINIEQRITSLEGQIAATRTELLKTSTISPDVQVPVEVKELQTTLEDVNGRLAKLEHAILVSPSKALEIPLLQRDLENVKTTQQATLSSVKDSVDRVYDLNKWLLGAMAVSVISLALATFLKGKEPSKSKG